MPFDGLFGKMPFLLREAKPSDNLVFVYLLNSADSKTHFTELMINSCKIAMKKKYLRVNVYNKLNSESHECIM